MWGLSRIVLWTRMRFLIKKLRNLWRTHIFGIKTLMCELECTAWVFYNDIVMTNSKSGYTVINGN